MCKCWNVIIQIQTGLTSHLHQLRQMMMSLLYHWNESVTCNQHQKDMHLHSLRVCDRFRWHSRAKLLTLSGRSGCQWPWIVWRKSRRTTNPSSSRHGDKILDGNQQVMDHTKCGAFTIYTSIAGTLMFLHHWPAYTRCRVIVNHEKIWENMKTYSITHILDLPLTNYWTCMGNTTEPLMLLKAVPQTITDVKM